MNDDDLAEWQMLYGFENGFDESNVYLVKHAAELGLTPWELSIFTAIHYGYGQVESKEKLADRSHGTHRNNAKSGTAIERCFREGWIQFVTAEFEQELRQELHDGGYALVNGLFGHDALREIQGGSVAGIISFGRRGAAIWKEWGNTGSNEEEPWPWHWASGFDPDGSSVVYGITIEACKIPLENIWNDSSFEHPFTREPVVPTGRWCDRWWQRFESGFRVRYSCHSRCE